MSKIRSKNKAGSIGLEKTNTGIKGLDEILGGGIPKGRITLVCGGPGCGKTLLATEFLVRGALEYAEPGVMMAFEETAEELSENVASLGIDLQDMIDRKKIFVDYVYIERSEIEESGIFDLEGLFVRLADAIETVGAKRVVLDTVETLFSGFTNEAVLRAELRRLFRWLKEQGVTTIVTGERGSGSLTRYGLEEYISDCVILLDQRLRDQIATRRLRVVKYRGSEHGNDEYPFLIDHQGIWVMPITSSGLTNVASSERISTGIPRLDMMLDEKGYFRGSSILVSGTAGTGKTSLAAHLLDAACRRGEDCLFIAFEESESQIIRNMRSIGIDLEQWSKKGRLYFLVARPSMNGIEMHLLLMQKMITEINPLVVAIDPITNLSSIGTPLEVKSMLVRVIDFLKVKNITTLFTSLTAGGEIEVNTEAGISSLMDTWILLRNTEVNGEYNRCLYVLKSRGMSHSSQVREFLLTGQGIELLDVCRGPNSVLLGSARLLQEASQKAEATQRQS